MPKPSANIAYLTAVLSPDTPTSTSSKCSQPPKASAATPLGPQCVRCRKRRVKCDSTKPSCQRCVRDGHGECPGYGARAVVWKVETVNSMKTVKGGRGGGSVGSSSARARDRNSAMSNTPDCRSDGSDKNIERDVEADLQDLDSSPWLRSTTTSSYVYTPVDTQSSWSSTLTHNNSARPRLTNTTTPTLGDPITHKSLLAPALSYLWDPFITDLNAHQYSPSFHHLQSPTLLAPSLTPQDHETFLFSDCLRYYNARMRPLLIGCLIPSEPREFLADEWASVPPLMKHNTVYALAAHRMARGDGNVEQLKMLAIVHRGRTVELLRRALDVMGMGVSKGEVGVYPTGTVFWGALVLIVMFMGGELGMSSFEEWETHYWAAWRVVEVQGRSVGGGVEDGKSDIERGVGSCWALGEEPQLACVYIIQMEVFSAATTPVWLLDRKMEKSVLGMLRKQELENMEDRFLVSTAPCPLEILTVLAEINDARCELYGSLQRGEGDRLGHESGEESGSWSQRLWKILTRLLCFQPKPWVEKTLKRHEQQVILAETEGGFDRQTMTESWTALADCYRSAAIVYLVRSCSSGYLSKALPEECKAFMDDAEDVLAEHRRALAEGLDFLLEGLMSKSPASSTKSQDIEARPILWRFVVWPLFVDAYEYVAWSKRPPCIVNQTRSDSMDSAHRGQSLIEQHRRLGRELGATCLFDAAKTLESIQLKRVARDKSWDWDDGFPKRVVFAM